MSQRPMGLSEPQRRALADLDQPGTYATKCRGPVLAGGATAAGYVPLWKAPAYAVMGADGAQAAAPTISGKTFQWLLDHACVAPLGTGTAPGAGAAGVATVGWDTRYAITAAGRAALQGGSGGGAGAGGGAGEKTGRKKGRTADGRDASAGNSGGALQDVRAPALEHECHR